MSINFEIHVKGGFVAAGGGEAQLTKAPERNYSKPISGFCGAAEKRIQLCFSLSSYSAGS